MARRVLPHTCPARPCVAPGRGSPRTVRRGSARAWPVAGGNGGRDRDGEHQVLFEPFRGGLEAARPPEGTSESNSIVFGEVEDLALRVPCPGKVRVPQRYCSF
jgi:hypothetical protein